MWGSRDGWSCGAGGCSGRLALSGRGKDEGRGRVLGEDGGRRVVGMVVEGNGGGGMLGRVDHRFVRGLDGWESVFAVIRLKGRLVVDGVAAV
ncbi:hypothetical protein Tco_0934174 [Tanacetum coccineum]